MKTPQDIYLQRHSPLSPDLYVPGMDLAINVSASLTPQERQMVIKEAIHKFPNVWEVTKSQVSYPKGSIHEHPIPTNPKNPEWYVKAYHQSPGKQKFLHDYADDLYKHGIIEDADRRCCITPALAVTKPGAPAGVFRFAQDFRSPISTLYDPISANMCPELIFPYIPYLLTYPSGSSPALSRRRKNTGVK